VTTAVRIEVFGRVQGVGFRAFTHRTARRQGVRGWVRNRLDGSVEALLIGADDAVAMVIEHCRRGPPKSRVDRLDRFAAADDGATDFVERPTA
jgi:acylphosphatase